MGFWDFLNIDKYNEQVKQADMTTTVNAMLKTVMGSKKGFSESQQAEIARRFVADFRTMKERKAKELTDQAEEIRNALQEHLE